MNELPLTMPAPLFWRLPVVRHVRWVVCVLRVNKWYAQWEFLGYYESRDFDRRVLQQIWKGVV